jgi:TfoX/Sxy family transcriptional regulator of competence genes
MPYNENIEARINRIISKWKNTDAKKMFGGICHLLNGNMFCGVYKDFLILRLGQEQAAQAMKQRHVRPFDMTGKPMKGWVMVDEKGFQDDALLKCWLDEAREYVKTLPSKP